ncbi:MAG: AAA family ATPase [Eubacterium sp.]|nr:AAA family ATPase [Eubacterium sp.]
MERIFFTEINILQIRHLRNIEIKLSQNEMKHLILTGVNGCGKTTVLNAISRSVGIHGWGFGGSTWEQFDFNISSDEIKIKSSLPNDVDGKKMYKAYKRGEFIQIYFPSDRKFEISKSRVVEVVDISTIKRPTEKMNHSFGQLLIYLYFEKLIAREKEENETVEDIERWFDWLENVLGELFENKQLKLILSLENMCFKIKLPDKEEFGLDEMASGYEALFHIFSEIVIRMEHQAHLKYDLPGIVLIDEIELHLHISWQKRVLPFLTKAFPNVQFIIATHSPFVASSIESAVVYDLEKNIRIENLSEYSYDCLVNSLFDTSMYSNIMSDKYRKYVELIKKEDSRNESEDEELVDLIKYFESIPVFMARDIILDFKKMERERQNG